MATARLRQEERSTIATDISDSVWARSASVRIGAPPCSLGSGGRAAGQLLFRAAADQHGQDVADGGFLTGRFRERQVRPDLVMVAAGLLLLPWLARKFQLSTLRNVSYHSRNLLPVFDFMRSLRCRPGESAVKRPRRDRAI
jgi:hypothetical protein